jgi:hypothetical protein
MTSDYLERTAMCQPRFHAASPGGCCCTPYLTPEDEIRMLEAMKTVETVRLDAIDRKIEELKKTEND